MPVTERRRITKTKQGTFRMQLPKDWADFFEIEEKADVDIIADTPVVVFPPQGVSKKDRIDALEKIITLLGATPEKPYPIAHRGPKGKQDRKEKKGEKGAGTS